MLVSISTLILYNKNVGSFTIRLPFNRIMASHVLFTLFGGFFLSASKISSTLLFFVGSIAFSVFSSIVTFLPWLLLWQSYKKYKNREQLPRFFVRFSSAPNDFSISCKRFFVLLRMIFHSVANDFPVDGSLLSGQRQHKTPLPYVQVFKREKGSHPSYML